MLCIIDYGLGNVNSVRNMLKKIGVSAQISRSPDDIRKAKKLILPGVGAFDTGMRNLHELGLIPVLEEQVFERSVPILGICLGMQLMSKSSEEGRLPGLGWIDGNTKRFLLDGANAHLPVPHMGWNEVAIAKPHWLSANLPANSRFYFVHSYHVDCANQDDVLLYANYGISFSAAICSRNVLGVQFHPEKSYKFGMALLESFARIEL